MELRSVVYCLLIIFCGVNSFKLSDLDQHGKAAGIKLHQSQLLGIHQNKGSYGITTPDNLPTSSTESSNDGTVYIEEDDSGSGDIIIVVVAAIVACVLVLCFACCCCKCVRSRCPWFSACCPTCLCCTDKKESYCCPCIINCCGTKY